MTLLAALFAAAILLGAVTAIAARIAEQRERIARDGKDTENA